MEINEFMNYGGMELMGKAIGTLAATILVVKIMVDFVFRNILSEEKVRTPKIIALYVINKIAYYFLFLLKTIVIVCGMFSLKSYNFNDLNVLICILSLEIVYKISLRVKRDIADNAIKNNGEKIDKVKLYKLVGEYEVKDGNLEIDSNLLSGEEYFIKEVGD